MATINIPAMYPFPAITLSGHPWHLRLIAHCLTAVEKGDYTPLCINLDYKLVSHLLLLDNEEEYKFSEAHDLFVRGMRTALTIPRHGGMIFNHAPQWAEYEHGISRVEAATYRPAWAWHMARHIYEQMGGD